MKARRWAPIVFGVSVFLVFVGISAVVLGVAWFREHLNVEAASDTSAEAAFNEVRQRYAAKAPLLEMHGPSTARRSAPPEDAPRSNLKTLHVLAWDAEDEQLARFDIPFWFLRLKETPIRFGTYASGLDELKISLTASEIERYGPGIIVDISREGRDRALLWVE
jgi:hypothetical protein